MSTAILLTRSLRLYSYLRERNSRFQAGELLALGAGGVCVSSDRVGSLYFTHISIGLSPVHQNDMFPRNSANKKIGLISRAKLTGGISLGRSTSFLIVLSPFLIGQLRSTFETWSQRFASVLTSLIRPYLTCRTTYAPSSTSSRNVATASMVRVVPLDKRRVR